MHDDIQIPLTYVKKIFIYCTNEKNNYVKGDVSTRKWAKSLLLFLKKMTQTNKSHVSLLKELERTGGFTLHELGR